MVKFHTYEMCSLLFELIELTLVRMLTHLLPTVLKNHGMEDSLSLVSDQL